MPTLWWVYELPSPLWKVNLIIPIKIKVYISFDPAFVLLDVYSSDILIHVQIDVCLKVCQLSLASVREQKFGKETEHPPVGN